jgi:acetyl esterase/lipase
MRSRFVFTILAAAGCAFLWLTTSGWLAVWAGDEVVTLKIPAKEVPVPSTVSPELKKVIAAPIPNVPVPETVEAWKAFVAKFDAVATENARAFAKAVGAKIEPTTIGGVPCFRITPKVIASECKARLLVHIHGGAFVLNGGEAATTEATLVADACKTRAISIDYRMPPDHPFPAALDDVVAVWKALLAAHDAKKMALFGSSAGGGLALSAVHRFKALKIAFPGALFAGTPASDCTKTGDSWYLNAEVDTSLGRYEGFVEACFHLYAGSRDPKDPLLSPIYGSFEGFPPTILISGTRDMLLSNTVRAHRKLRAAGVEADLHVYEGQSHADYMKSFPSPESRDALREIARFFDKHLER